MSHPRPRIWIGVCGFILLIVLTNTVIGQSKSPVAPSEQAYNSFVKQAYENLKDDSSGKNADYFSTRQG
jgi:uncharacterized membrane protein YdfJ with MMPL/SSD domain